MAAAQPQTRDDFEVAIVCALPFEFDAIACTFDRFWDEDGDQYGRADGDYNSYTTGRIGHYDVVLALLPGMGKANAASAAASMRSSYRHLRLVLVVGVCGGNPVSGRSNLFLGDVVISEMVLQYDFGRQYPDSFVRKDTIHDSLGRPNKDIRGLLAFFSTYHGLDRLRKRTAALLEQLQDKAGPRRLINYEYPTERGCVDQAFASTHRHMHYVSNSCICRTVRRPSDPVCDEALTKSCADLGCLTDSCVARIRNYTLPPRPEIHIGIVASGDLVLKSALRRDRLHKETGAIAFEMEGAGVWDEAPCIVIKGICDYADSHKQKYWQSFAAATAASAAKAVLERYIRTDKSDTERTREAATTATEAGTSRAGPTFNGPISGRNVMSGISVSGGTANFHFG